MIFALKIAFLFYIQKNALLFLMNKQKNISKNSFTIIKKRKRIVFIIDFVVYEAKN